MWATFFFQIIPRWLQHIPVDSHLISIPLRRVGQWRRRKIWHTHWRKVTSVNDDQLNLLCPQVQNVGATLPETSHVAQGCEVQKTLTREKTESSVWKNGSLIRLAFWVINVWKTYDETGQVGLQETSCECLGHTWGGLRRTPVSRSPPAWTLPGWPLDTATCPSAVLGLATTLSLKMTQLSNADKTFSLNFECQHLGLQNVREIELK